MPANRREKPQTPQSRAGKSVLVLGGTGFIGPHIVESLLRKGHTVTLFNRGQTNTELFPTLEKLAGNRDGGLDALKNKGWDAVIDTAGFVPRLVRASARLLRHSTEHYIFISSVSVYSDFSTGPDERSALAILPEPGSEETQKYYGPLKALCEQAAEQELPGRVCVIRPGLIVGPFDKTDRFTYWPARLAQGGEVLAPGDKNAPVQLIDVRDLADWIEKLVTTRTSGVFNAVGPAQPLRMIDFLEGCRSAVESDSTLTWVHEDFLQKKQIKAWSQLPCWIPASGESSGFLRTQNTKAIEAGLGFRPLQETARDTMRWFDSLPGDRKANLAAGLSLQQEAELLRAWHDQESDAADH